MDTQPEVAPSTLVSTSSGDATQFQVGDTVFYGVHGRCKITSIENRTAGGSSLALFRLIPVRPIPTKPGRQESAIWMPVSTAYQSGLRHTLSAKDLDQAYALLSNEECAFHLRSPWPKVQPQLEATLRTEGPIGLAKAAGYLYLVRQRDLAPPRGLIRFAEMVQRLLVREIQAITDETPRVIEERIEKLLKSKLRYES